MRELKQAYEKIETLLRQLDEARLLVTLQKTSNIELLQREERLRKSLAEEAEKNRLVKSTWLFRFMYWKYYRKKFIKSCQQISQNR